MANLKIIIDGPLMDGHRVTFKAPCACTGIDKLDIRYIDDNTQKSKLFTMKDTHGNNLTGLGNLFDEGAYVQAILSLSDNGAYLQNAATNGYLEGRLDEKAPSNHNHDGVYAPNQHSHAYLPTANVVNNLTTTGAGYALDARQGKELNDRMTDLVIARTVTSNASVSQYGNATINIPVPSVSGYKAISASLAYTATHDMHCTACYLNGSNVTMVLHSPHTGTNGTVGATVLYIRS